GRPAHADLAVLRADLSARRPEHGRRVSESETARAAPADRTGSGGAGRGTTGPPGAEPVQPAPAHRRGARTRAGAGPRRPGGPRPVARRVSDERQRLGLLRPGPRPRGGGRRRATPRTARTRTGPGRDLRPLSSECLVKEYRLWRSPKSASSSWKT